MKRAIFISFLILTACTQMKAEKRNSASVTTSGVTVQLNGNVSDDGLPKSPGKTTVHWTVVTGPGPVDFTDAGDPKTSAYFSKAGLYTLRLTATDGNLESHDDVII